MMKTLLRALALAAMLAPLSPFAADELTEATVKKVDQAAGLVTLSHGPIANLGMPPMTMMFKAKEPAMLKKVKAGDKVRFRAEETGGTYLVVHIEPAK